MDITKYANLLAKLAYEDDFRQRFTADPRGTLAAMGIVDPKDLPDQVVLAPKEILQKEYEDRLLRIAVRPSMPMAGLL
ncbi:MAG TPA: hypothetical protein VNM90_03950 [Haliangium sp.]|nr:hypothetical protein [Haliangium sp.]